VPFASAHENVEAHFVEADGSSYARQIITDLDYNTRFEVSWQKETDGWRVELLVNAIDKERAVRVQPFFYFTKERASFKFPFNPSVERCDNERVRSVKVLKQKDLSENLNEDGEYHVFEVSGVREGQADICAENSIDLGLFTMNFDMYLNDLL